MSDQQTTINSITAEMEATKNVLAAVQADTQQLSSGVTDLEATVNSLKSALADTQKAQPALDLVSLQNAADSVSAQVGALKVAADSTVARLAPPPSA